MDLEEKISLVCSLLERLGIGKVSSVTKEGFFMEDTWDFYPFESGLGNDLESFVDEVVIPWIAVVEMDLPEDVSPEELGMMLESEGFSR